jgi:PAS domain S-box-containing protein
MNDPVSDAFRWQTFFQHAAQPIFLVNARRRILFVNRAWETCTGLTFAEVRGRPCRRRSSKSALDHEEAILSTCAPPRDALDGRACQARRRVPLRTDWWEIHYQPLAGAAGLLGILGVIHVLATPPDAPFTLPDRLMALRDRQASRYRLDDLGANSPSLERLKEQARLAARTNLPVTLVGAAGTGKAWLARAIHHASDARQKYFACLDAERLPAERLGEVFLSARNRPMGLGTLYLREPASLPREWQTRIAEAVRSQENAGDSPRLIVGHRKDPKAAIEAGRLLEELHCAVSPIEMTLPNLRERLDEMPRLVDVFLQRANALQPHAVLGVGNEALAILRSHDWPGNLRELQDVVREACGRAKGERIEPADLPFSIRHGQLPPERRLPLDALLEQVERRLIALALKLTQNNQTRAAELLEVWRPRLVRRIEKLGLGE